MRLSPFVSELIDAFKIKPSLSEEGETTGVSHTVTTLAVWYEKARNAVEFRADHLVRRAAIERILKRRTLTSRNVKKIAENLVLELLWAKYIDSSLVDEERIKRIENILERYITVKDEFRMIKLKKDELSWELLLGIASSEIDEEIVTGKRREALVKFFYLSVRGKIDVPGVKEEELDTLVYIAVERAFAQSDDALILFNLLKMAQPEWFKKSKEKSQEAFPLVKKSIAIIRSSLNNPLTNKLTRFVRSQMPAFLLLRDFMFEKGEAAEKLVKDEVEFEEALTLVCEKRYSEIGIRVKRAVIRSFIYIFLTKMVFALAIEIPYDFYVARDVTFIPLMVNTLFPPLFLVMIAGFSSVPGEENTRRLVKRVKKAIYHFDDFGKESNRFKLAEPKRKPGLTIVFTLLYIFTFLFTFGAMNALLNLLHFSIVSKVIFAFFVAIVSFFAYHIRVSAKEYQVVESQEVLTPVADFFFLPILRAGQVISGGIARLNMLAFFFDFILEAPLKTIFEVVEEWIRFIRTKKEEII